MSKACTVHFVLLFSTWFEACNLGLVCTTSWCDYQFFYLLCIERATCIYCFVRKSDLFTTSYILYIEVRFFMLLCYILFITGIPASETSSSIIAGAATGGSIAGIIAVLVPIIAGLIYYRRRKMKSLVRHKRYVFPNLNCSVGSYSTS